jgi:hypothetical protein
MESLFGLIGGAAVFCGIYFLLRRLPEVGVEIKPSNPDHISARATVIEIDNQVTAGKVTGRVRVGPESWRAVFEGVAPSVGDSVRVLSRSNLTLMCSADMGSGKVRIESDPVREPPARLIAAFGRVTAGILFFFVSVAACLGLARFPASDGLALFGLLAPFASVLGLIFVGNLRTPDQGGLSVRALRTVIAGSCGFATFVAIAASLGAAIMPIVSAMVLAIFDPVLGEVFGVFGVGAGGGDA